LNPKRPLSLVCDGQHLPAITENTELVSLNGGGIHSPLHLANTIKDFPLSNIQSYKIDPKIIQKAENLLNSNKASLDNMDLTVTSLSYIDENGLTSPPAPNSVRHCFTRGSAKSPEIVKYVIRMIFSL
jgi:hypothetical protein